MAPNVQSICQPFKVVSLTSSAISRPNYPFDVRFKYAYGLIPKMPRQPLVQFWIWISAFATLTGWTLSAFGELNRTGYAVAFIAFAIFTFVALKNSGHAGLQKFQGKKLFRRFRRPLPFCY